MHTAEGEEAILAVDAKLLSGLNVPVHGSTVV